MGTGLDSTRQPTGRGVSTRSGREPPRRRLGTFVEGAQGPAVSLNKLQVLVLSRL